MGVSATGSLGWFVTSEWLERSLCEVKAAAAVDTVQNKKIVRNPIFVQVCIILIECIIYMSMYP